MKAKKLPFSYAAAQMGCPIVTREGHTARYLATVYLFGTPHMLISIRLKREGYTKHDNIVYYAVDGEGKYPCTEHERHPFDLFIRPKGDPFELARSIDFEYHIN